MTILRSMTSVTVAAALAAAAMGPLAAAANAEGWRDGHRGHHFARHAPRRHWRGGHRGHHFARHAPRRHWRGGHNHRRYVYRKRDKTGKYIAIGLGAFMLGIIAAQAHRPYYD